MKIIRVAQQTINIDYNKLAQMIEAKMFANNPANIDQTENNTVAGTIYNGIANIGNNNNPQSMVVYNQLSNNQGRNSPMSQLYDSVSESAHKTNPAWAQWKPLGNYIGPQDANNNLNFYFSIEKTPENLEKFLRSIPSLVQQLYSFGAQNRSSISFKIPGSLGAFARHNDSLKIYFKNISIKDSLNEFVTRFLSGNGISTSNRTHSFGQDVGGESYGIRMAMRAQSWIQQAVNQGHPTDKIIEGFKNLESNFFKSIGQ